MRLLSDVYGHQTKTKEYKNRDFLLLQFKDPAKVNLLQEPIKSYIKNKPKQINLQENLHCHDNRDIALKGQSIFTEPVCQNITILFPNVIL